MKAQPLKITEFGYKACSAAEATHVMLNVPGPIPTRIVPVILKGKGRTRPGTTCWPWNGDTENPTLERAIRNQVAGCVCHTFVNDGEARFLDDCTHEFAGQTVELLDVDWDEWC